MWYLELRLQCYQNHIWNILSQVCSARDLYKYYMEMIGQVTYVCTSLSSQFSSCSTARFMYATHGPNNNFPITTAHSQLKVDTTHYKSWNNATSSKILYSNSAHSGQSCNKSQTRVNRTFALLKRPGHPTVIVRHLSYHATRTGPANIVADPWIVKHGNISNKLLYQL